MIKCWCLIWIWSKRWWSLLWLMNGNLLFLTENRTKRDIVTTLVQHGYPSDPIKAWKDTQKSSAPDEGDTDDASSVASSTSSAGGPDFGYLLSMSMLSLSREKKEELLKERDNKVSGSIYLEFNFLLCLKFTLLYFWFRWYTVCVW